MGVSSQAAEPQCPEDPSLFEPRAASSPHTVLTHTVTAISLEVEDGGKAGDRTSPRHRKSGQRLTGGELALQLLEDGVLSGGLRPPSQRLGGGAGEHGGDIGHVLQAHPKRAHQLLDEIESVGGDFGIRHSPAFLKCDRVTFRQALLELPENLVGRTRGSSPNTALPPSD